MKNKFLGSMGKEVEDVDGMSLLDLPELALECILEKLQPNELCRMTEVCPLLRDHCRGDYLWESHMEKKWGRVIGDIASVEWDVCVEKKKKKKKKGTNTKNALPVDSLMYWYLCLENGKFWFPAQVYNRQNGDVSFIMSCYDAQLCYDSLTNTFRARYPGLVDPELPVIEEYVPWDRIRAPPIDNPPRNLHVSDCLHDLHPGDHIEIQWKQNGELIHGWWYGVVGHLETCDKVGTLCQCHKKDTVVLEFNQYPPGSLWRSTTINRKDHWDKGSIAPGFYGGIRKINDNEQIAVWKKLLPNEIPGGGILWLG